jgi:SAM-dependent methyltransferase
MHSQAREFVARCLEGIGPRQRVVEFGGRDVNGSVRDLFGGTSAGEAGRLPEYTSVDLRDGRGVDVAADAAEYSPGEAPDTVVCCEVLEHAENAAEIVANAHRILCPDGVLVLTAATVGRAPHGCDGGAVGDEFYRSVSVDELAEWLRPFRWHKVEVDPEAGDIRALAVKE